MEKTFTKPFTLLYKICLILIILSGTSIPAIAKIVSLNKITVYADDQTINFNDIPVKTYGDTKIFNPGATASSGLTVTYISSDITVARVVGGTNIEIMSAGTVTITAEQPGSAQYNRATRVSKTLIINKADLSIKADNQTRVYGNNNPGLTVAYSGFKYNDNVLTVRPTVSTVATVNSAVGTYPITIRGGSSVNYNILSRNEGTLTITRAPLTITARDKVKTYGTPNTALTVAYTGFKNRENANVLLSPAVVSTTVNTTTVPGTYPIEVNGATAQNYTITNVNGTFTVDKANLKITAVNKTKVYGAALPALTTTYTGFVLGQDATVLSNPVTISTTALQTSTVGTYPITASGAVAANYNITYTQGTLTVTKATLRITADNKTKAFGTENPELTLTYSGFVLGETPAVLTDAAVAVTTAQTNSAVGKYPITINGGVADNYTVIKTNGTLTINKAVLTITANSKSKEYGSENPVLTFTYSGFVDGDSENSLTTLPTISTTAVTSSNAGRYPITVRGAVSNNYSITYVNSILTISKAIITVTANDVTRLYGSTTPALSFTYSGFVNGQTATVITRRPTITAPVTSTSPAGTYVITVANAAATNYDFVYETGALTIAKRTITFTATSKTKAYGAAVPGLTYTYTGLITGERIGVVTGTPQLSTTATQTSERGVYPITIGGDVTAQNYNIAFVDGTLTVGKALVTVTVANKSKIYGRANPVFTYTYSGFANGDNESSLTTLPETPTTTATESSPVGTYAITTTGGASDDNYDFKYVAGRLTITRKTLTVTIAGATKVYGQPNPQGAYTISGFVNGDTEETSITSKPVLVFPAENTRAGTFNITGTPGVASNYQFAFVNGRFTITRAPLQIAANNESREYGKPNPNFTATYTGFVNGDTEAALTTAPTISTTATLNSDLGAYPITVSGAVAANYSITYVPGTLTVTRIKLIVKAENKARDYGSANPEFTLTYSGFVNGDSEALFTAQPVASTTANASSNAGSYDINVSGGAIPGYDLIYQKGTLTVNKAVLTVNGQDATRIYGAANPVFTAAYTGFVNGETPEVLTRQATGSTTAITASPVGTYPINFSGATAANYTFTYNPSILTVTPASLLITANNKSRVYGAANPVFNATYSGFVNGETPGVLTRPATFTTTATTASPVGNYAITPGGAVSANYNITYANGTLTITKAQIVAKADDKTKTYGDANPAFTVTYTGFANGETSAVLTSLATASANVNATTVPGNYAITPSGGLAANYDLTYANGTLTISKAVLTVTANDVSRAYGVANLAFVLTYSGFKGTDDAASLTTAPTATTTATAISPAGNYAIVPANGVSDKYSFSYRNGTLTIGKTNLVITAENKAKLYGTANPALTVTYSGFINGDTPASLTTAPVVTTAANTASAVGTYAIIASGAVSNNYNIIYSNGILTVNKAQLTVTADNKTKIYGEANPAFTVSYSGFVNGENSTVLTSPATTSVAANVNAGTGAGTYAITPAGATAANYNMVYINGTLTINKAQLTITANNATRLFGTANPAFTVTYSGFLNGDNAASIGTPPTVTTTATVTSPVGTYPISPGQAASANYSFVYANGVLTITAANTTITFATLPAKTFGDADFAPTATNTVNEPMVYTSGNTAVATIVNGNIHIVGAGTTTITAAFAANSNYSQTAPVSQLLVVNKANQVITFNTLPAITRGESYTVTGLTASSGLPVTLTSADVTLVSVQGLTLNGNQIGNTTITATQAGNNNYNAAAVVMQPVQVINVAGKVDIEVHQAVSPNGDGINDVLFIEGIKNHPNNQVTVINRNGVKIFEIKGYDNVTRVFDGHSNINGALQQPGTYFYLIEYMVNGQGRHLTGYFVLKY